MPTTTSLVGRLDVVPVSLVYGPGSAHYAGALLSPDRRYRYVLERRWGSGPFAMFIGLNPSTADEAQDDQTVRKVCGFARRWGYGGILLGNLYAFRARQPRDLAKADDPVGPDNDVWLTTMSLRSMIVIACWGADPMAVSSRVLEVTQAVGGQVLCLGTTAAGHPRHPLYLPYKAELCSLPST